MKNNFDRPVDITVDEPSNAGGGEAVQSASATSEATHFTVMNDLNRNHFCIRAIKQVNFVRFDLRKPDALTVPLRRWKVRLPCLQAPSCWFGGR